MGAGGRYQIGGDGTTADLNLALLVEKTIPREETGVPEEVQLSQRIGVQFSFVDSYDSEAESRGALSNNDGQIFFGVVGTF